MGYVVISVEDILGLVNHLTTAYWIGLSLITLTSIVAFLDRDTKKKDAIFIVILFALGLFLVVLPAFIYEYPTENANYYPFSEIARWLPTHHLAINNPPNLTSYYSWPGFHFLSASIVTIWGASFSFIEFAKYVPIFFLFFFILITYSIGKRLDLEPKQCFLLSFLALSSWLMITADYAPRTLGILLFLLLFMLLLVPKRTVADSILVILIFTTIVLTHSLTALAALLATIFLSFYRKDYRFISLFAVIFGFWYIYEASTALQTGILQALTYPLRQVFLVGKMEYGSGATSTARIISLYSLYGYGALYVALLVGSVVLLLRRRIMGERHKQIMSALAWSIGVASVTVLMGFTDAFQRTYVFAFVPAVCIFVLSFPYMRRIKTVLIIILMLVFVTLYLPAEYGDAVAWGQVLVTNAKGAEFFALRVKPTESYFCMNSLASYYDPNLINIPIYDSGIYNAVPTNIDISALDKLRYVIINKKGTNHAIFQWGKDPYAAWPQTENGQKADLIYNNSEYQIYLNYLVE